MVRILRRLDRIEGDLDAPTGTVFETDRCRDPGGEFAVDLALRGAGSDRAPADQVSNELRADGVEEFRSGRDSQFGEVEQE